jgi:hypothetical protein
MFRRVNVPVLGIVENMSYFQCPECGTRADIFGHGGARHEAERQGVPFLGEVPLHIEIREKSDAGLPVVATDPDGAHAKIYREIAASAPDRHRGVERPAAAFYLSMISSEKPVPTFRDHALVRGHVLINWRCLLHS